MRHMLETLESRRLLSVTPFAEPRAIVSSSVSSPTIVEVADIDGDGSNDLFLGTYSGLTWLRQTPSGFADAVEEFGRTPGAIADVNGDGLLDIVHPDFGDLATHLNTGQGTFQRIDTRLDVNLGSRSSVALIDWDLDGDRDALLMARDSRQGFSGIGWMANDGQGQFGQFQPLISINDVFRGSFSDFVVGDIDGDGDHDVVVLDHNPFASSAERQTLAWHENTGAGFTVHAIVAPTKLDGEASLTLADATGDGKLELIVEPPADSSSHRIEVVVMGFDDASRTFVRLPEFSMGEAATRLAFADIDLDGDTDVVRSSGNRLEWFARESASSFQAEGTFIARLENHIDDISVADLDGDGRADVAAVSSEFNVVTYYKNTASGQFTEQRLLRSSLDELEEVVAVDFDQDQQVDLIARGKYLSWLRATDNTGNFSTSDLIDKQMVAMRIGDLDGDGDMDIAATDATTLYLITNQGGGVTTTQALGMGGKVLLDVDWDGDGDLDLITGNDGDFFIDDASLSWYENRGGMQFSAPIQFATNFGVSSIDELQPVKSADARMRFALLENARGSDRWTIKLVGANDDNSAFVSSPLVQTTIDDVRMDFAVADTDGNGFDEIIVHVNFDGDYEHRHWFDLTADGAVERPFAELLATLDRDRLSDVDYFADRKDWLPLTGGFVLTRRQDAAFMDVNGDNLVDLVTANSSSVFWQENLTQARNWNADQQVDARDIDLLSAAIQANDIDAAFDVNQDQLVNHVDLEVMVRDELGRRIADVNLDGKFDSSDLVRLFQAGKYETNESALWSEGDFNSDGRFDSSDLTLALRFGYDDGDD
jgi:hypothetical protein